VDRKPANSGRAEDRALHIVEDHAEIVRSLFQRYLEVGSVVCLKQRLDAEGFRLPVRINGAAVSTGGGSISRGHIHKILCNPIYVGRIGHRGHMHEGQHLPIVRQDMWEQVQQCLRDHLGPERTRRTRQTSEAPLAGKLFDDRGNRMSPSWAKKGSRRWRYYVSQAALQGDKSKAGSVIRVAGLRSNIVLRRQSASSRLTSPTRESTDTMFCRRRRSQKQMKHPPKSA
jgi:hypothetical protein